MLVVALSVLAATGVGAQTASPLAPDRIEAGASFDRASYCSSGLASPFLGESASVAAVSRYLDADGLAVDA